MALRLTPEQAERMKVLGSRGRPRLLPSQIRAVKEMLQQGKTQPQIMMKVPICMESITRIKRGVYDKYLED